MSRIEEIKARAENATPGPWEAVRDPSYYDSLSDIKSADGKLDACIAGACSLDELQANTAFLAHAREDIPWLMARVERLEKALRRISRRSMSMTFSEAQLISDMKKIASEALRYEDESDGS